LSGFQSQGYAPMSKRLLIGFWVGEHTDSDVGDV
jgi:hypothetical protein